MSEIVINSVLPDQFQEVRNVVPSGGAEVDKAAQVLAAALDRAETARQANKKRDGGFPLPKGHQ